MTGFDLIDILSVWPPVYGLVIGGFGGDVKYGTTSILFFYNKFSVSTCL